LKKWAFLEKLLKIREHFPDLSLKVKKVKMDRASLLQARTGETVLNFFTL
jgi:hypothetical protein